MRALSWGSWAWWSVTLYHTLRLRVHPINGLYFAVRSVDGQHPKAAILQLLQRCEWAKTVVTGTSSSVAPPIGATPTTPHTILHRPPTDR